MGEMNAADGTPTGALFGLTTMLVRAVEDIKPDYLIVAFDAHGPTFRHEMYEEYKAHRDEAPDELKQQLQMSREVVDALGMDWMELDGFEADDVIGTLARKAEVKGWDVKIVTGDSDLGQLATDNVTIYQTVRGVTERRILNPAKVREKYGIAEPEYLVDYKGLVGDPSDNIPGVRGVGDKTARKLLAKFPTIDDIYEHLEEIEEKFRKKLEPAEEIAKFSRELATIKVDLPLELDEQSAKEYRYDFGHIDRDKASKMFSRLGFRMLSDRLGLDYREPEPCESSTDDFNSVLIDDEPELKGLIKKIIAAKRFALDFETSSLDARTSEMVGIAVSIDGKTGYYIPVGHRPSITDQNKKQIPLKAALKHFKPVWEDPEIQKICQNGKFEWLVCMNHGIELNGLTDDPMIADYLIDSDNRHGLKEMVLREFEHQMTNIEELIGKKGKNQLSMADVSIDKVYPYACADAIFTQRLADLYKSRLENDALCDLYGDVEIPLEVMLAEMEAVGIRVNPEVLGELSEELEQKMADVSNVIFQEIGEEINLNSPKQLSELFFDRLNYPQIKKRSTDAAVLEKLGEEHELPGMVLEYRSLAKLHGTYTKSLIELIDPDDGRIHTSYNQTVTSTGRLSSSNPNLQNIPIRTEQGRGIRKAFEANKDDEVLVSADYSQIELRLLAHFSEDPVLVKAFNNDEDIHSRTAMEMFGVDPDGVTSDMRRSAKVINFGIIYGMGPDGLSKALKKSRAECRDFISKFFERYPKVRDYMDHNVEFGRKYGYVKTILGRRKYYRDLDSPNQMQRSAAERAAINMPLQGTAADIIKLAMVKLRDMMTGEGLGRKILLQVHDELVLSVPENRLEEVVGMVGKTMADIIKLHIPLVVNCKAGPNWLDMEPAGDFRSS